jgi:FkbH-like protein
MQELRQKVNEHLAAGRWAEAKRALETLWRGHPRAGEAQFVVASYAKMQPSWPVAKGKLAILRSVTVEPLVSLLRAEALIEARLQLEVKLGEFNAYTQEILNPSSWLYEYEPDAILLATQTQDVAPELWEGFACLDAEGVADVQERVVAQFEALFDALRDRSSAALIFHGLERPEGLAFGIADGMAERTQAGAIDEINNRLRAAARSRLGVYFLDYDQLIAHEGRRGWRDARKWMMVRLPFAAGRHAAIAKHWVRYLAPALGLGAKVLVTDLDNTLWQGVLGEEGQAGIRCDDEYPGGFHRGLQRALLDLRERGVLLAVASKNNEDEAMAALREHPDLLLRPEHFAAIRCNWTDKATNLRAIAQELNVGLDSLAFLDDSPAERDQVAAAAPEVHVLDVAELPAGFEAAVREFPLFERLSLSAEDRARGGYYEARKQRETARASAGSLEDYYRSLEQVVEIAPVSALTIDRVAQLTQKTNQFNLTTKRYTPQQIAEAAGRPDTRVFAVRVSDRYGDNGIVAVAIVVDADRRREIDTLLMSCRVIGRTVERAILSHLADSAASAGCEELRGWFKPTAKNAPAADFYCRNGFRAVETDEEQGTLWSLPLADSALSCPEWIRLKAHEQEPARELSYSR